MRGSDKEITAAERSRWLFELAQAIDEAQWAALQIGAADGRNPEAIELYRRLEAARREIEQLRVRIVVSRIEPHGRADDPRPPWERRRRARPKF